MTTHKQPQPEPTAADIGKELSALACGHGCLIAAPRGMATNGGCKHARFKADHDAVKQMQRALLLYRQLVKVQAAELAQLRAKVKP